MSHEWVPKGVWRMAGRRRMSAEGGEEVGEEAEEVRPRGAAARCTRVRGPS